MNFLASTPTSAFEAHMPKVWRASLLAMCFILFFTLSPGIQAQYERVDEFLPTSGIEIYKTSNDHFYFVALNLQEPSLVFDFVTAEPTPCLTSTESASCAVSSEYKGTLLREFRTRSGQPEQPSQSNQQPIVAISSVFGGAWDCTVAGNVVESHPAHSCGQIEWPIRIDGEIVTHGQRYATGTPIFPDPNHDINQLAALCFDRGPNASAHIHIGVEATTTVCNNKIYSYSHYFSASGTARRARNYLTVADRNGDGTNESLVYCIANSEDVGAGATQEQIFNACKSFLGISASEPLPVLHLDGGGSVQLRTRNRNLVVGGSSERRLFSGFMIQSDCEFLDTSTNTLDAWIRNPLYHLCRSRNSDKIPIMSGDRETDRIRISDPINRAEFVKLLFEGITHPDTVQFNEPTTPPFPDVPISEWYAKYVQFGKDHGIIQGRDCDDQPGVKCFHGSDSIIRAEAVKILAESVPGVKLKLQEIVDQCNGTASCIQQAELFPDASEFIQDGPNVNAWYFYHLYAAKRSKFIDGKNGEFFAPGDPLTRGQAAKLICFATFSKEVCEADPPRFCQSSGESNCVKPIRLLTGQ